MKLDLKAFARATSGVAAVEFALLMPLTVFTMLAEFDTYRYVMATQRAEVIAASVAQMFASSSADKTGTVVTTGDGLVGDWDVNFYENSSYFLYPDILNAASQAGQPWYQYLQVNVAAIKMVPQSGGTYLPQTAWHGANASSGTNNRQCNTNYSLVADSSVSSPTTLPIDVVGPNSLIVVDVRLTFTPTFGSAFLPPVSISRSVFMPPRNVPFVEYQGSGWMAVNCP